MAEVAGVKENVKRVFYVRFVNHPIYLDLIAQRPEIRLDKLENDSPEVMTAPVMSAAHAYQVSSARDELPVKYHVDKPLLAKAPNLLIVSTGGAGYDTVMTQARASQARLVRPRPARERSRCRGAPAWRPNRGWTRVSDGLNVLFGVIPHVRHHV